jgi:dynein heavy chain
MRHSEHPPIMKDPSWTKASPFKETAYARTPSESIANNYSPMAANLKLRSLSKGIQSPRAPSRQQTMQGWYLCSHAPAL